MTDEKKKLTTLQMRNRYKAGKISLNVAKYLSPVIPATVVTAVNWEEWFQKSSTSLPFGFATLLISIITSIYLILKRDEYMEKFSPIISALVLTTLFGVSFMFLANIGDQIGKMFLYTSAGLIGSIGADEADKLIVSPRLNEYNKLVADYGLDKKTKAKALREQQAKQERDAQAKAEANREATE